MKAFYRIVFVLLLLSNHLYSQTSADAAVQITASVTVSPPQILLSWVTNTTTNQYQIFRKLKNATQWGSALSIVNSSTGQYADNAVSVGVNYEYRVTRLGSGYTGYGYINAGIKIPETEQRGKVILIVDSTVMIPLSTELSRLITDMEGDGWEVIRHDVLRTGSVKHVKSIIVADYAIDSAKIKAVFLFGHVPVPYSGNINPDGHPDHLGAWPADCYYADIDGTWTDLSVTSTTASPARTQNIPGDGKFDQSIVPSDLELQVGRVDFNGMPIFTTTEIQLLKNYLNKDHDYRKKIFSPIQRAVVDDNFGYFGSEAFAASGYKSFAPIVGSASITSNDYFTTMSAGSYAWSYGCGGGTYNSAGGIGTTTDFSNANLQGVFTMLFGSYFGDWDAQDNFLRAALAQGKVLTNVWSGRPHYQFHHMGLGENIGYGLLLTQNNLGNVYFASPTGITGRWVHNALMGDPTLRNNIIAPVSNVIATKNGYDCFVSWTASNEPGILGYNIYMKNDTNNHYIKLNSVPVAGTTFTDQCLLYKGIYSYMVRALTLQTTPSGSYYNLSEGIADTAYNSSTIRTYAGFSNTITGNVVSFSNLSSNATSYNWTIGSITSTSISPVITFSTNGIYPVTLIAKNGCASDTVHSTFIIQEVGLENYGANSDFNLFPNPASTYFNVEVINANLSRISISNCVGQVVYFNDRLENGERIDVSELKKGIYFVKLDNYETQRTVKLIIQ